MKGINFALGILLFPALAFGQTTPLNFRPLAAEYSRSLDRIIAISANPDRLHIYDPSTNTDTIVALSKTPLSLSVSPDGAFAAVGHDLLVSHVSLVAASVQRTYAIGFKAMTVAMGTGWIYTFGPYSQSTYSESAVSINTANASLTSLNIYYYPTAPRLNPAVNAIYATRDGVFPDDLQRYNVSTGPITQETDSIYHGDYNICSPVYFSADGSRIYTGCGPVFRASTNSSLDMRYLTTLPTGGSCAALPNRRRGMNSASLHGRTTTRARTIRSCSMAAII